MEILATYETFQLHLSAYFRGTILNMQESTLCYHSARTWLFCACILGCAVGKSQQTLESASSDGKALPLPTKREARYGRSLELILINFNYRETRLIFWHVREQNIENHYPNINLNNKRLSIRQPF